MKKLLALGVVCAVALVGGFTVAQAREEGPESKLISGEVISLCNYLVRGQQGEEGHEAGIFLTEKKGLPIAILEDDTNKIYIAIWKGFQSATPKLAPLMGKKVNAKGMVYSHGGTNLIELQIVSEQ